MAGALAKQWQRILNLVIPNQKPRAEAFRKHDIAAPPCPVFVQYYIFNPSSIEACFHDRKKIKIAKFADICKPRENCH